MTEAGCNIYGLFDPVSGVCRYIGKTVQDVQGRLRGHLNDKSRNHRTNWFKSLASRGLQPVAKLLATVPEAEAADEEIALIASMRASGAELLNATDGGEGTPGRVLSEGTKQKIGRKNRKNKLSPAARLRLIASRDNEATRAKMSYAAKLRASSPEGLKHLRRASELGLKARYGLE